VLLLSTKVKKGILRLNDPQIDKRNTFAEEVFTYRANKDGKVFIFWYGKQVMIIKDKAAKQFLAKVAGLDQRQTHW
jgi:hypothetical protein